MDSPKLCVELKSILLLRLQTHLPLKFFVKFEKVKFEFIYIYK
jgi:hypothetical protein